jgi:hypothetical protein
MLLNDVGGAVADVYLVLAGLHKIKKIPSRFFWLTS